MFKNITASSGMSGFPEFLMATLPSAAAAAWTGRVVLCTDLASGTLLRSNGSAWYALFPYTVDQNTRSDTVTGASAESLMHSINISDAVRYMGPKGRLKIMAQWSFPNTANAKNVRIRIGTTAGTAATQLMILALSGTGNTIAEKTLYANNSEASQTSSSASAGTSAASGSVINTTLNFAPGGDTVIVSLLSAPVGAGEVVTLNSYSISIEPGF